MPDKKIDSNPFFWNHIFAEASVALVVCTVACLCFRFPRHIFIGCVCGVIALCCGAISGYLNPLND